MKTKFCDHCRGVFELHDWKYRYPVQNRAGSHSAQVSAKYLMVPECMTHEQSVWRKIPVPVSGEEKLGHVT